MSEIASSHRGDLDAWLTLALLPGFGPAKLKACLQRFENVQAIVDCTSAQLAENQGIGLKTADQLCRQIQQIRSDQTLDREKELIAQHQVHVITRDDMQYPKLLHHIHDPPMLLYVQGKLLPEDAVALAVVGSRKPSHYGQEQAKRLALLCAQAGLCIVSGGAYGIDAICHRAAIQAKGRTIAVTGSGLADPYPKAHVPMFEQIATGFGAVISEYPMTSPPRGENFPRRNRIISGMVLGVLVVEATTRSGALITARLAAEEHGREVMALPGRVDSLTSAGCHKMLQQGWATLVTSCGDILDALGETGQLLKAAQAPASPAQDDSASPEPGNNPQTLGLSPTQKQITQALGQPMFIDEILSHTGLSAQAVRSDLTMLEIRGIVTKTGNQYVRPGK